MIDFSGIQIKKVADYVDKETGAITADFHIAPIYRGYGHTLGNSLRRVLLSSLQGYSITSVRINDLDHEFATIAGVKENVLDIILRLKKIRFKVSGDSPSYVITVNKKGKGVLKAGDIKTPANVEVVNKDYELAHLTESSAVFAMEATLEKGVGYQPANDVLRNEIGRIPVDALFSPVLLVSFNVVPARKGARADYDGIDMTIKTDGSITPLDALKQAFSVLSNLYNILSTTSVEEVSEANLRDTFVDVATDKKEIKKETVTKSTTEGTDISELSLNDKYTKLLKDAGFKTVEDLAVAEKDDILAIKGLGPKAYEDIKKAVDNFGKK